ncbi:MAG: Ger(x)C family spore germination C-terminal domain-containing protein, partial [Clostridia bacterium]|nr:Ger(x)C family spore germination C-terminal domain-containing protein [Clostridia bacterium]
SFKTDKSETPVTVLVGLDSRPIISYNKKEHKSKVKLALTADFVALPDDYAAENDLEHFEKIAEKAVKEEAVNLISKTQTLFNSDIIGFGEAAKRKFLTREEFDAFDWESQYRNMRYSVDVELNVRRTGLTLRNDI